MKNGRWHRLWSQVALAVVLAPALGAVAAPSGSTGDARLASVPAEAAGASEAAGFDGVVEAVRQTVIAAQVAGAVVALEVRAGDTVKAGQLLLRLDARAAEQTAQSGDAQVRAARASLDAASREFARQQQLFAQNYISQAALDRSESQFKTTQADLAAQIAQAGAARTQSGLYVVRAPYAGVVADVPVAIGDMALPGRTLLTLYDPAALRVVVAIPQSAVAAVSANAEIKVELPGLPAAQQWVKPLRSTVLPTADATTHTQPVRLDLPATTRATPGMFARAWLPIASERARRVLVPGQAVVRRAEVSAVYVVDSDGRARLRLVRVGRPVDDRVEILSGVAAGERVALDPQAAARQP